MTKEFKKNVEQLRSDLRDLESVMLRGIQQIEQKYGIHVSNIYLLDTYSFGDVLPRTIGVRTHAEIRGNN
jgi:hypothetical protein